MRANHRSRALPVHVQVADVEIALGAVELLARAAVDRARSFPLFFTTTKEAIVITDEYTNLIDKKGSYTLNTKSTNEYMGCGYTIGNSTLVDSISQINSCQSFHFRNDEIVAYTYDSYLLNKSVDYESIFAKEKLKDILIQSFQRFITSLNNRTVVVALSGGYDSRLIAAMLK